LRKTQSEAKSVKTCIKPKRKSVKHECLKRKAPA